MIGFSEIFEDKTKYGTKLKTDEYQEQGKYLIVDQGQELIAGYTDKEGEFFSELPVIIFGDHTRILKYIDQPFYIGADGVKILRCKLENANYKYLFYALKNVYIPNTGYNRHFKWLKQSRIKYPDSVTQNRIVKILDTVSGIIQLRKKELNQLDCLIKARFIEMFGDPITNTKGWEIEKAEKHIDLLSGFPFDSSRYTEYGIKICGGLIIMPLRIDWDSCKYWSSTKGFEEYTLRENDIVMALDRPWISEGFKIAMVGAGELPALLIQRTARIRAIDINQHYLMHCFILGGFDNHCNVTGSLVPHISAKDIRSFPIMLPPIELQEQFATFVEQIDKSKVAVQNFILNRLYQAIIESIVLKMKGEKDGRF